MSITDEQWREIQEALPKVGESEDLWVCVRGGTLRALAWKPAPVSPEGVLRDALEIGLSAAEQVLAERQAALAGYPHRWVHEQADVDTIKRALAQEARPAPAALSKFVRSSEKEREAIGERVAESAIKAQQQVIEQAAPASPEGALREALAAQSEPGSDHE